MDWEREESKAASYDYDEMKRRRFAGGIEIVGEPEDALGDRDIAERDTQEGNEDG